MKRTKPDKIIGGKPDASAATGKDGALEKRCTLCGGPISAARLEALSGVTTCIECAKKWPLKVDTSRIELSEASPINRNGFAPKE